ncbi:FkbM family methyltransferase [soil metagenome]
MSKPIPERRLSDHPLGTYALSGATLAWRNWANGLPDSKPARWVMSLVRRFTLSGRAEPVDVPIFAGLHARLYPTTNRCEKRMFVGERTWDAEERAALGKALAASRPDRSFVFVDGGANVGMYTLSMLSEARKAGRAVKAIAIEPDPTNLGRLRDNLAASAAHEASVAPYALGAERGVAMIESEQTNRGEVRVSDKGTVEVALMPLAEILAEAGVDYVDALKLDIEGYELPVLTAFFAKAAKALWPRLILLEVQKHGETPAYDLCLKSGYELAERTRLNALLRLKA